MKGVDRSDQHKSSENRHAAKLPPKSDKVTPKKAKIQKMCAAKSDRKNEKSDMLHPKGRTQKRKASLSVPQKRQTNLESANWKTKSAPLIERVAFCIPKSGHRKLLTAFCIPKSGRPKMRFAFYNPKSGRLPLLRCQKRQSNAQKSESVKKKT